MLYPLCPCFTVAFMDGSKTIKVGDPVPEFTLPAANRDHPVSLAELRARGPVIVEFLRGTW